MVAPRVLRGTDLVLTLPERVARLFEGSGVRILPPPIDLPPLSGHLVWHERLSRDAASLWFRKLVEETAGERGAR
jgi:DNA-binding transcriptional LysR family regulator